MRDAETLLRTTLRVSEYTSLQVGAVVHIGARPWLHVPGGKLCEDRYLPLHPHLVALIDDYRSAHVSSSRPLLPRENGRALDQHAVTRYITKAGAAAGRSLDMSLPYAKVASRTVADEYFAVTSKVEGPPRPLPPQRHADAGTSHDQLDKDHPA